MRQRALFVPDKAQRVANFHQNTLKALKELVEAAGLCHPREITAQHIVHRLDKDTSGALVVARTLAARAYAPLAA